MLDNFDILEDEAVEVVDTLDRKQVEEGTQVHRTQVVVDMAVAENLDCFALEPSLDHILDELDLAHFVCCFLSPILRFNPLISFFYK